MFHYWIFFSPPHPPPTPNTCLKIYSLRAAAETVSAGRYLSFNGLHRFIFRGHYHEARCSSPSRSKLRRNDSFRVLCVSIFHRLKCQVASFHPALCLLTTAERNVCLGMRLRAYSAFPPPSDRRRTRAQWYTANVVCIWRRIYSPLGSIPELIKYE